jgi:hypothetical protein
MDQVDRSTVDVVPVVYVGGSQRSGSTLLDRMLGQVSGHESAGEIVHLWARGLKNNELCGCGIAFLDCPFWSQVGRIAFGGWDHVRVDEVLSLQRRVDRNRYIVFMLVPSLWPRYHRDLRAYTSILERLYRAIRQVAGGNAIIDSSKHASTAFLLRRVAGLRPRIIHLVRDSRGVAFSLLKHVRKPEVVGRDEFMQRIGPWRSGSEWLVFNGLFHILRWVGSPSLLVRYEDLVRSPEDTLRDITAFDGTPPPSGTFPFIDGPSVTLGVDHTVAGNPMRFKHGTFELSLDETWARSMRARQRRITTGLTWPLLLAYRYLGVGRTAA